MKIKFNTDNNLPLNKPLKLHQLTIIVRFFLKMIVNFIRNFIQAAIYLSYNNGNKNKTNEN